jgi:thiamine pyrophosphate-dependent acetolactate synthase large subunit-like protein
MGIYGQRVDDPEKLAKALKFALESNKPELIEVPVEGRM